MIVKKYELNKLSLAKIGSEKLSSKNDSDLFCSEKLISLDWLREAQSLNSIITQTCFTQHIFESFYCHWYLIYQNSRFWVSILILKVQRTSMSIKSSFWALENTASSWCWWGILILIWIWSLVFDTPMLWILALYLDFESVKNIHVL